MDPIVSQIFAPFVNVATDLIKTHLGYATCSKKYVNNMRNKMKVLEDASTDVKKHMDTNNINDKEIPTGVPSWLNDVEDLKRKVESISSDGISCLNMKMRYRAGRKAFKATESIKELITKNYGFTWTDAPIPTGRVNPQPVSSTTSTSESSSSCGDGFKSRDMPFNDALKFLQQDDDKSQVIALCGMGGVGKTTMMEQLKDDKNVKMRFQYIVKVAIGSDPNMESIQKDIALCLGGEALREGTITARGDGLCRRFKNILDDDRKKVLVILDDVWEKVKLQDIGLTSPLPKGVKLLLTSRFSNICQEIAVDAFSALHEVKVDVLTEAEANNFFSRITQVSEENDHEKYLIGCDIVKKCSLLPLAIKLLASTLKSKEAYVWRSALNRLNNNDDINKVQEVIKISYEHIKEDEEKNIFLHCGLFPEDYDIPIEDLTRHAWSLKLLRNVSSLREARDRVNTCMSNLIDANLLMRSNYVECVKMHDLVLAFVLAKVSKSDHAWVIKHGDVSKLGRDETCKRISLTCRGLSEFPTDIKYPNVSLLQLMDGEMSLTFPIDFYANMEKLQVIAYYQIQYPWLPRSFQCSTNLKSLCLHACKLLFDYSFVGDLVNLEVLSFAYCGIRKLPSTLGNLRKLKLLDLTACADLHIEDGIFKNFKNLEELYMTVSSIYEQAIRFTNANLEELKMLSSKLFALEVEFAEKNTPLKNFSFAQLCKFKIAMGCLLKEYMYNNESSFKNTLKLVTDSKNDLHECKINELFKKTEILYLRVTDMIGLEDIVSIHPDGQHPFCYLKDLKVYGCVELKYLCAMSMASSLRKLERLTVSSCSALEALVGSDGREINCVDEIIKFDKLKFLCLKKLPKLVCLFMVDNAVELPQLVELEVDELPNFTSIYPDGNNISALLNSQVRTSGLKKLRVTSMENLKKIWTCNSIEEKEEVNNIYMLKEIEVEGCDSLVNLFPTNPKHLLEHLEEIKVKKCGSIQEILNIDFGRGSEIEQISSNLRSILVEGCVSVVNLFPTNPMRLLKHLEELKVVECSSIEEIFNIDLESADIKVAQVSKNKLRSIQVFSSMNLREVWRIKGGENNSNSICGFEAVESIEIRDCWRFRNVFTPTNTKFDLRALTYIDICPWGPKDLYEELQYDEQCKFDDISTVAFQSNLYMETFHYLRRLCMRYCYGVEVVFEMDSSSTVNDQQPPPNLQHVLLVGMKSMSHVWKWNEFLLLQNQSSFRNLTTICLKKCKRIKYLFSPLMAKLLSGLQEIDISNCSAMEEVVSNRDDKFKEMTTSATTYTTTNFFPSLHSLSFRNLKNLKSIGGGGVHDKFKLPQVSVTTWSLCQCSRRVEIVSCDALSSVIPSYTTGQMQNLEVLKVDSCDSLTEVFETQVINNNSSDASSSTHIDEGNGGNDTTTPVIKGLENINVSRLSNLKELVIVSCDLLQHVFTFSTLDSLKQLKELTVIGCEAMKVIVKKENEEQRKVIVFPRLKSLQLIALPNLNGFFLGLNEFKWSLLESITISHCPQMMAFTHGESMAPKLKYIHTSLGKHSAEYGLNFQVTTNSHQTSTSLEGLPWSFHSLIEIDMEESYDSGVKKIIPSNELVHLQKLERIRLYKCWYVEEVFEMEGTNSEPQTNVVEIPKLTKMELEHLSKLKYIWRNNHHRRTTLLKLPNLTTLSINYCDALKHVFTSSMVGSLLQLQHLSISYCKNMEVVVKVEEEEEVEEKKDEEEVPKLELPVKVEEETEFECDAKVKEIVTLRCLKSLKLSHLKSLKGFCLGEIGFSCPSLHTLEVKYCQEIKVFSKGHLDALALNLIDTCFGRCYINGDLNSFITTKQAEGFQF